MRNTAFAVGVLLLAVASPAAWTEETGSLRGRVLEPDDSPLPGAVLTLRHEQTGEVRHTTAGENGTYVFAGLPSGSYEVTASLLGFTTERKTLIAVTTEPITIDFRLSLLLDVEVVTASKHRRTIARSPAIITAITGRELAERGIRSLADALSYVPSVEVMETYYGYTAIGFRGILPDHYNNKATLLLNGQPLYDQVVSSFYLEQIPISAIDRIEVVRGPAGVLYGTNAYAGAINIITKSGAQEQGADGSFLGGSFATRHARVSAGNVLGDVDVFFAGEYLASDGYPKTVTYDEDDEQLGVPFAHNSAGTRQLGQYADDRRAYQNNYVNFFTSAEYRGVKANLMYFANQKDKMGIVPTMVSTGERHLEGLGVNLRYDRKGLAGDKLGLSGIVWFDKIEKDERIESYPPVARAKGRPDDQHYAGHKFGGQVELEWSASSRIGLRAGAGYEDARSDPYLFSLVDGGNPDGSQVVDPAGTAYTDKHDTADAWLFAQAQVQAGDKVEVIVGGRVNHNRQAGTAVIPNVAVVFSASKTLALKALYGSGFRNPSFFEKYVRSVNVLAGSEQLDPETIDTFELGLDWNLVRDHSLRLNGFYAKTDNLVGRRTLAAADLAALNAEPGFGSGSLVWTKGSMYENKKGRTYRGVELEVKGRARATLEYFANVSLKDGEDNAGDDLLFFAKTQANLGVTVKPIPKLRLFGGVQYVGKRNTTFTALNAWNKWSPTKPTLPSYTLVNLHASFALREGLSIVVQGNNLLDEQYDYPEYIRQGLPSIPGGPGRAGYAGIALTLGR